MQRFVSLSKSQVDIGVTYANLNMTWESITRALDKFKEFLDIKILLRRGLFQKECLVGGDELLKS
jgi:hypothetical protein